MLTLTDNVRMGAFTVFRDVSFEGGSRALTSTFYALPDAPRLALDGDGGPAFRFWWYRRTLDPAALAAGGDAARAGGLLTATVELGPTRAERAQLTHDLAAQFQIAGGETAINLLPMPFVSGTVALAFAADPGSAGDFVNKVAGNGPARLAGEEQAAFAVDLTRDGAALLASAIDQRLAILHVRYDLVFEYHLDGVRLHVWCDARRAQSVAQAQAAAGLLDPATLGAGLVASQLAGITIDSDTPVPADRQAALQQLGRQLLDAALAAALLAPDGKSVRPYDDSAAATLNHTFTSSFAAGQHAVAEAILRLEVDDSTRATRVAVIDLASEPQPIDVTVLCPIDFTGGLIAAVHFFIAYDGTGPDSKPIHRADDVVFKSGTGSFLFHTPASADERSYRWHADVQYRDGTSATLAETTTDALLLVLPVDGLGVLDVQVALGDVPLDLVSSVIVDLEYPPRQLTHEMVLDGSHASDVWRAVVGEVLPQALRWRATFLTSDRRVVGDWQNATSGRLFVNAPVGLGATSGVQLVSAGDFTDVAQILVDLSTGANDDIAAQFSFTRPGQTELWAAHLAFGGTLAYRARRTVIGADGVARAFDWTDENSPLLVIRDESRFTVQVVTRLLDLGGAWSAATVAFEHVDPPANLDERDTLVLRDRTHDGTWSFRLGPSGQHEYRYQLTLLPAGGGQRRALPWQQTGDQVLVLRPPSA
jgi:hypothetical protein